MVQCFSTVKFGKHNAIVRERLSTLDGGTYFVIDYNTLKKLCGTNVDLNQFKTEWRKQHQKHIKWVKSNTTSMWISVFKAISHDPASRGVPSEEALRMFVKLSSTPSPDTATTSETKSATSITNITTASDLLRRFKRSELACTNNHEALRKSIKKFDKSHTTLIASSTLLPELYATVDSSSKWTDYIKTLNVALSKVSGSMIPRWWNLMNQIHHSPDMKSKTSPSLQPEKLVLDNSQNSEADKFRTMQREINDRRRSEIEWLNDTAKNTIPDQVRQKLVLHRGFHSMNDDGNRPIENSLTAYETAWSSGMKYCECDISLTLDEHIVLCHDANFKRLALFKEDNNSLRAVSELTFRELIALPLKSGQRPPLLMDVLNSASKIGNGSQLVVEIKPGNAGAAQALCGLFEHEPHLLDSIGVIMSFDLWVIHQFAQQFQQLEKKLKKQGKYKPKTFKILLLTISDPVEGPPYLRLNIDDSNIDAILEDWMHSSGCKLDGIYLQYEKKMLNENKDVMERLTKRMVVGVWGYAKRDPDDLENATKLMELGVHFVNTDMPRSFTN